MSRQDINIGAAPNDGTGDNLRTAFGKANANFVELYVAAGGGLRVAELTTSAVSQDYAIQKGVQVVRVTSSGTGAGVAGDDILNLVLPEPDEATGWSWPDYIGTRVYVILEGQTDPGDRLRVSLDGEFGTTIASPVLLGFFQEDVGPVLDFAGAAVCLENIYDGWVYNPDLADEEFEGPIAGIAIQLRTVGAHTDAPASSSGIYGVNNDGGGAGGSIGLIGGGDYSDGAVGGEAYVAGGESGLGRGGSASVLGGQGVNGGGDANLWGGGTANTGTTPGNAVIKPGYNAADDTWGDVRVERLPTAMPASDRFIMWKSGGVLKISDDPTTLTLSGDAPTDCDPTLGLVTLSTDGTGRAQVVNLPLLPVDENGINASAVGQTIVFSLPAQADPGDTVTIYSDGSDGFTVYGNGPFQMVAFQGTATPILDYAGAITAFIWCGDSWQWFPQVTDGDDGSDVSVVAYNFFKPFRYSGAATSYPGNVYEVWSDGGNLKVGIAPAGATGTFTTADAKTVTVTNGVITDIS